VKGGAAVAERAGGPRLAAQAREEMPHLVEEHRVAFEAFGRRGSLPRARGRRVQPRRVVVVVPRHGALGADDDEAVFGGTLDEVQVDVPGGPAAEAEHDVGARLDRQREPVASRFDRVNRADVADQPAQVVEGMAQGQEDPAAKILARGVPGPVVFPGMHTGQVFAAVHLRGDDPPDRARG
jgi:hypothetical protein